MADLLTVYEVQRHLGIDAGTDPALIDELITAAQSVIEGETKRSLATAATYTEYHMGGRDYICVNRPPIISITSVTDDAQYGSRSIAATNWIDGTDDNGANYEAGIVELWNTESCFAPGRSQVKVVYVGGWTTATLPAGLRQAWIDLVSYWYNNADRLGKITASAGGEAVTYDQEDIPEPIAKRIRRWVITSREAL
jgi:hypothetical protein